MTWTSNYNAISRDETPIVREREGDCSTILETAALGKYTLVPDFF